MVLLSSSFEKLNELNESSVLLCSQPTLLEAKFKFVRKRRLTGAEKAKNKRNYRKNKSSIKRAGKRFRRSSRGRKYQRLKSIFDKRTPSRRMFRRKIEF